VSTGRDRLRVVRELGADSGAAWRPDRVRQVPARKVLDAALKMLPETSVGVQTKETTGGENEVRLKQSVFSLDPVFYIY